jgi:hypothetical protein
MKEQFVTFEIALKMQKLGFSQPCFSYFGDKRLNTNSNSYTHSITFIYSSEIFDEEELEEEELIVLAPTWQQAIDWLFENYKITIMYVPQKDILEIDILRAIKSIKK